MLDVNYGSALRELLATKLGVVALHVLEPQAEAFPGTATTAAITCFRVGEASRQVCPQSVKSVHQIALDRGTALPGRALQSAPRWSILVRPSRPDDAAADGIELGELLRVHRGQATGANQVWIDGPHAGSVPPRFKLPSVTKARELILAGQRLRHGHELRRVIDLPEQLDELARDERRDVDTFLRWARGRGGQRLHRAASQGVVVDALARAGADPVHLHGKASAAIHAQHLRRTPHHLHVPRIEALGR